MNAKFSELAAVYQVYLIAWKSELASSSSPSDGSLASLNVKKKYLFVAHSRCCRRVRKKCCYLSSVWSFGISMEMSNIRAYFVKEKLKVKLTD